MAWTSGELAQVLAVALDAARREARRSERDLRNVARRSFRRRALRDGTTRPGGSFDSIRIVVRQTGRLTISVEFLQDTFYFGIQDYPRLRDEITRRIVDAWGRTAARGIFNLFRGLVRRIVSGERR